ncbi:MAG: hypothetical protein A2Z11_02660 [Candidatus Woykebacteria bacterium RBG_16_43_9]|uniref:Polymerase III, delta prime subunit protein n=1 Tax=Candidatus Woykebacteria bacterium RBG_16_43_9 TaxID=1802596 RepID=A0A1G1WGV8_9BACT|nr:MAG: hypothetical protein A2Z11_02660 [Candidatus Woykebacteria bacterium RBG_16_43_9]
MNLSTLIVGGQATTRKGKALELASKTSSKFDIQTLDTKESYGIGDIKKLSTHIYRRPYESLFQSFLILEAQNLTVEAQSALLKNLEEPPERTRFILTAPSTEGLLSTISSRCQKIDLGVSTQVTFNFEQIKSFYSKGSLERYKSTDKLDVDAWLAFWRQVLLSKLGIGTPPVTVKSAPQRILKYIKLLNKLKEMQKRRASQKIIKTIIMLESPEINF